MIYDITRTISPDLAVWPGDTPFGLSYLMHLDAGDAVNLTTLTTTAHLGTHADAYYHYEPLGAHPSAMPLESYIGLARVVTVTRKDGALMPEDFTHVDITGTQRLLIHSHVSDLDDHTWAETFPHLSVPLIEWLAASNIVLIGLDSPSVDAFTSTDLPCHHALYRHNMVNLESLLLRGVPDGEYELFAPPLKMDLACGSPVRAVLRTLDH